MPNPSHTTNRRRPRCRPTARNPRKEPGLVFLAAEALVNFECLRGWGMELPDQAVEDEEATEQALAPVAGLSATGACALSASTRELAPRPQTLQAPGQRRPADTQPPRRPGTVAPAGLQRHSSARARASSTAPAKVVRPGRPGSQALARPAKSAICRVCASVLSMACSRTFSSSRTLGHGGAAGPGPPPVPGRCCRCGPIFSSRCSQSRSRSSSRSRRGGSGMLSTLSR